MSKRSRLAGKPLTAREQEILNAVVEGFGSRDIGDLLFIAERTARTHTSNILAKLGAHNRTDAVRIARETGLLDGTAPVAVELPPRYRHRNGEQEPPTEVGYFWTEIETAGEQNLIQLAAAPWGEWRQRWMGKGWEPHEPEKLRELGMRFWGQLLAPWDEDTHDWRP